MPPQATRAAKAAADEELLREHRRLFYVALTRAPRPALHLWLRRQDRRRKPAPVHELAQVAARQMDVSVHARRRMESAPSAVSKMRMAKKPQAVQTSRPCPTGFEPDRRPNRRCPIPSAPPDIRGGASSFSPLGAGPARFLRGNVVHALLARLPELASPERRSEIALKFRPCE